MEDADLIRLIDAGAEDSGFSGIVSIGRAEAPVVRAYGYADRGNRVANVPHTRFGIASGTKFLTALAVGALVDRGTLSYDTRVKDVVSFDLPNFADDITIAHLLSHTSGIFDYYDEELVEDFDNFHVDIPWSFLTTPTDYLPLFQNKGMKFPPGRRFSYSNGGYILLGIVIEEVTHRLFRDFVREAVFVPAGMTDSGFFALNELPERTAVGYMPKEDGDYRSNVYNLPKIGASDGGAFLTAVDMGRLWRAFFAGGVVEPATRDAFLSPRADINSEVAYGYGLYIWKALPQPAFFLMGSDAGVGFDSRHFPESGVTVTIMSNITDGEARMRTRILYEHLEAFAAVGTVPRAPKSSDS